MAAECPFCGYRNTAYEVQMHIDERHAYNSPLPTRQALHRPRDYQPRQPKRNSPALPRERGERFRLSPPAPEPKHYPIERRPLKPHPLEEYPIREKRIITKKYPIDEPWIQCGRQGCGMYVARDVMNQHLDMHDMYEYEAERENAKRMQQRRLSAGGAMKRLDYVPFDPDGDGALSDYSRRDSFVDPGGKGGSLMSGDTAKSGSRPKSQGGQSGGSMGSNGLRQKRFGSSGKDRNGQGGGGGDGGNGGDESSASKKRPKSTNKDDRRGGWSRSSIYSKNKGKNAAKSRSGNSQKGADASDPSSNGPADGMLNNTANTGRNGNRPSSNSGASQRNGSGGGGGGGGGGGNNSPSNPSDIRRRIDSGNGDTSNLELQLAKLLLANRGGGGASGGGGSGNDPNLINSALGLPNAPSPRNPNPPKPNSTFSLSGVSTSELLQAIQKKTNGSGGPGGRGQGQGQSMPFPSDADAGGLNNASSRIPSEAAGLLAAIVASRVRS